MIQVFDHKRFIILTGNYGSGKTELALNLAFSFAEAGLRTTLVDLDIVNPYFRSGEKYHEMEDAGVRMLMPTFALTTVDIPALPAEIQSVFELPSDKVIFDVGGDDTGAAALSRYHHAFAQRRDQTMMALVVNCMRPLTGNQEDIMDLALRISSRSRMQIDMMINNTNLANDTTPQMIETGESITASCAARMNIPCIVSAGMPEIIGQANCHNPILSVRRYMVPEWMDSI